MRIKKLPEFKIKDLITAAVLLGILVVFTVLSVNREKQVKTDEEAKETVLLRWMVVGEEYPDTDKVISAFNERLKDYLPGISVEFDITSRSGYLKDWETAIMAGSSFDLAWFSSDIGDFTQEVRDGSLMAVDFALETFGSDILKSINDGEWSRVRHGSNTYAIPSPGVAYRSLPCAIAKDYYMERYGDIEKIGEVNRRNVWSTDECYDVFEPFLSGILSAGDIGKGVSALSFSSLADKGYEGICGWDSPFAIRLYEDGLKVVNKYEEDAYRIYFSRMAKWYAAGYIRQDIRDVLDPLAEDGKNNGSVLYIGEYNGDGIGLSGAEPEYSAVCESLQEEKFIPFEGARNAIVVPKTSVHPAEAIQLLDLLYSEQGKDLYRMLVNGFESDHYIRLNNGTIVRRHDNDGRLLYSLPPGSVGNTFRNFERKTGEFDTVEEYNRSAKLSPLTGFELDTRMIAEELAAAELTVNTYVPELSRGYLTDWEEVYREFIEQMKRGGSDKIIKEIQRQIDIFLVEENVRS